MESSEARRRFAAARVARLATVDASGQPHLVPVTFAVRGDTVVIAVDHKPKKSVDLKRLRNIAANDRVSLLVDHYDEAWAALWWVRVDGVAVVVRDRVAAVSWLVEKYPQYGGRSPAGPAIVIEVAVWRGWAAS